MNNDNDQALVTAPYQQLTTYDEDMHSHNHALPKIAMDDF